MTAPYRTIRTVVEHETEIRRSRFICALAPVDGEEAAREFIAERRRLYADASHNCVAYVISEGGGSRGVRRADDDGEPGGTAGTPMLEMLTRRGFADVVAVVTRYFGGVLLGAGGLARAYGGTVGETLDRAQVVDMVPAAVVTVLVGHAQAGRLESDLRASSYAVRGVDYSVDDGDGHGARVAFEVTVAEDRLPAFEEWIAAVTAGRAETALGETVHLAR
ncbi:IMPACT family protein [Microbispora sp. NBC_01389]|uniref:IMPACT family protein n=1 Tax=Microbispora sp. NBC_01389 TaxID=2903584 RepID=UPI003246E8CD